LASRPGCDQNSNSRKQMRGGIRVLVVTVIVRPAQERLPHHLIEPDKRDRRNQNNEPGRWPSSQK
jgi:hypothetical protein